MKNLLKDNYKTYKMLNAYMQAEIYIMFYYVIIGTSFGVILTKLQGFEFAATTIGIMMVVVKIVDLNAHTIKDLKLSTKYLIIMILDMIMILNLLMYEHIDLSNWLISTIIILGLFNMFLDSYYIDYDVIKRETLNGPLIKDLGYLHRFIFAIAGIVSAILITSLLKIFIIDDDGIIGIENVIYIITLFMVYVLYKEYRQYRLYYKDMIVQHKEKEKREESKVLMTLEEYQNKFK